MDFLENTLKIEDTKSIQIEKADRLGKRKNGPTKPRPIVVKFTNFKDRAAVKNTSNRLKNTKYGISLHYPREMVECRKKIVPIMLNERKMGKLRILSVINCSLVGACGKVRGLWSVMKIILKTNLVGKV